MLTILLPTGIKGLSRVKALGNLYIEDQVTKEAFSVDPHVEIEYCRLKTQCYLATSQVAVGFSAALLNTRTLYKYILAFKFIHLLEMLILFF